MDSVAAFTQQMLSLAAAASGNTDPQQKFDLAALLKTLSAGTSSNPLSAAPPCSSLMTNSSPAMVHSTIASRIHDHQRNNFSPTTTVSVPLSVGPSPISAVAIPSSSSNATSPHSVDSSATTTTGSAGSTSPPTAALMPGHNRPQSLELTPRVMESGGGGRKRSTPMARRQHFLLLDKQQQQQQYTNGQQHASSQITVPIPRSVLNERCPFVPIKPVYAPSGHGRQILIYDSRSHPGCRREFAYKTRFTNQSGLTTVYYRCMACRALRHRLQRLWPKEKLPAVPCIAVKNDLLINDPDFPEASDHFCAPLTVEESNERLRQTFERGNKRARMKLETWEEGSSELPAHQPQVPAASSVNSGKTTRSSNNPRKRRNSTQTSASKFDPTIVKKEAPDADLAELNLWTNTAFESDHKMNGNSEDIKGHNAICPNNNESADTLSRFASERILLQPKHPSTRCFDIKSECIGVEDTLSAKSTSICGNSDSSASPTMLRNGSDGDVDVVGLDSNSNNVGGESAVLLRASSPYSHNSAVNNMKQANAINAVIKDDPENDIPKKRSRLDALLRLHDVRNAEDKSISPNLLMSALSSTVKGSSDKRNPSIAASTALQQLANSLGSSGQMSNNNLVHTSVANNFNTVSSLFDSWNAMKNAGLGMPEQHQQQPKRSNRKRQFNQGDSILHAIAARLSQKNGQPTANKELQRALSSTKASSNGSNHPTSSNNDSQLLQKLFGNNFSQSNSLYPECSADNNNSTEAFTNGNNESKHAQTVNNAIETTSQAEFLCALLLMLAKSMRWNNASIGGVNLKSSQIKEKTLGLFISSNNTHNQQIYEIAEEMAARMLSFGLRIIGYCSDANGQQQFAPPRTIQWTSDGSHLYSNSDFLVVFGTRSFDFSRCKVGVRLLVITENLYQTIEFANSLDIGRFSDIFFVTSSDLPLDALDSSPMLRTFAEHQRLFIIPQNGATAIYH